jgi:hypothetical protein
MIGNQVVTVFSAPSGDEGAGEAILELQNAGKPVYSNTFAGETPQAMRCSPTPSPNCVLVDGTGAHASSARGFKVLATSMAQFGVVDSDTPETIAGDLNDDGWIDVITDQDTYMPDYATGKVYWQTFTSNGVTFTSTGCTVPAPTLPRTPSAPLTGACPS